MDFTLKRAKVEDLGDYARIGRINSSRLNVVLTERDEIIQEITCKQSRVYMIQVEGVSIGIVSYAIKTPKRAYISELQILPEFQKKGIGGRALDMILEELTGMEIIDLLTHPKSDAQELYRRHGFQETGDVFENYNGDGEPRMRMLFMRRESPQSV